MNKEQVYIGVDVAKASLDVAWAEERRQLSNDAAGFKQLVKWVEKAGKKVQVICEASGGYERALVRALQATNIRVSVVSASRVRQYARAAGILAKTDRIDAAVLCAFGEAIKPEVTATREATQERLRELEAHRRHLSVLIGGGKEPGRANERRGRAQIERQAGAANAQADRCTRSAH
ncbi:MAG: transposase [Verrucomicrobiota bacterium]|jgi:transposase